MKNFSDLLFFQGENESNQNEIPLPAARREEGR